MVDRIGKIHPRGHLRVDESKDSTEDEGQSNTPDQEDDGPQDGFNSVLDKTDWRVLLDHPQSQQKRIDVPIADIAELVFIKINLKTNPSLLNVKILLKDGLVYPSAYVSVPRHVAVPLQHVRPQTVLHPEDVTEERVLAFFVPDVRVTAHEEVTVVTPEEKTFSQTVKLLFKRTWAQKIGIQDPDTKTPNQEIIWAYVTVAVVVASLLFALVLIMM
jgi:hypothetical protein